MRETHRMIIPEEVVEGENSYNHHEQMVQKSSKKQSTQFIASSVPS
jgi:hypothetical protein